MRFGWFARRAVLSLPAAFLLVGCDRDPVRTYRIPKEQRVAVAEEPAPPRMTWKTPSGWEEMDAGEMRLATFRVKGNGDAVADVSIIPLPGHAGGDLPNVNRWRGQVGLSPITPEELIKTAEKVQISGIEAQLYDLAGQNPSANEKEHILAAILHHGGTAWFFKMIGPDTLVASQKTAFVGFLKSVQLHDGHSHGAMPEGHPPAGGDAAPKVVAQSPSESSAKPQWSVPAGWQEVPPGQMQMAKFAVSGEGSSKGEVSVAVIPGDGGGVLANVNRWRRQLGLGPVAESDLPKQTSTVTVGGIQALVLDVTSEDKQRRMVAISVPREGSTWFYKLMGDEGLVGTQKDKLVQFVQSTK